MKKKCKICGNMRNMDYEYSKFNDEICGYCLFEQDQELSQSTSSEVKDGKTN